MSKPVLISYCATFLKPEMLHVYRQVKGVRNFDNWVLTRRRQNAVQFPFAQTVVLQKSPWRGLRRALYRLQGRPVPLGSGEVRQMLALSRDKNAALIHIYFGTEAARALPYLKKETRPKVVSFHGADVSRSLATADLEALIQHVDMFLARSQTLADELLRRGCPPGKIRLTRTSVPIPDDLPVHQLAEHEPLRLLQACRFIPKKGLDIALRALALLLERGLDVRLDLAGDGPERGHLEQLVRELGLEERVSFLGFLPNAELLARLPSYTLFIHPSRETAAGDREGIPNSMLEAMAAAVPVVATAHSGIPEAVTHGVEGLLVAPDDVLALADAIALAVGDRERYAAMAQASRERVIRDFSEAGAIRALEDAYRSAIQANAVKA